MKRLVRDLTWSDLLVDVPFALMWVMLAVGDLIHGGDWGTSLIHFWTGVIVALFISRLQYRARLARRAQRDYQKLTDDHLRTMLAVTTIMQHQHADPEQIKAHLRN